MAFIVLRPTFIEKEIIIDIFKNKIPYTPKFKLDLTIEPGCMIEFEKWVPAKHKQEYFGNNFLIPWKDLQVNVAYDDIVLVDQPVDDNDIVVNGHMVDVVGQHKLKISLSNKTDLHSFTFDSSGQTAVAMIRVKIEIEELPINFALTEQLLYHHSDCDQVTNWSEYMGWNGYQEIHIDTPIYPWLFGHEKSILEEYSLITTGQTLREIYSKF